MSKSEPPIHHAIQQKRIRIVINRANKLKVVIAWNALLDKWGVVGGGTRPSNDLSNVDGLQESLGERDQLAKKV